MAKKRTGSIDTCVAKIGAVMHTIPFTPTAPPGTSAATDGGTDPIQNDVSIVDINIDEADELPEELTETPTTPPQLYITLEGKEGQLLHGGVNGVPFSLPCGVEIPVTEPIYHAVKAHITNERQE